MNWMTTGPSYEPSQTASAFLWLAYNVLKAHPRHSRCQNSLSFQSWMTLHFTDGQHFVYPVILWWTFKLFPFLNRELTPSLDQGSHPGTRALVLRSLGEPQRGQLGDMHVSYSQEVWGQDSDPGSPTSGIFLHPGLWFCIQKSVWLTATSVKG